MNPHDSIGIDASAIQTISGYLCRLMEIQFTEREQKTFQKIAAAAESIDAPCYLIGGFVRDKILGRPTKDADFVCVGDALQRGIL